MILARIGSSNNDVDIGGASLVTRSARTRTVKYQKFKCHPARTIESCACQTKLSQELSHRRAGRIPPQLQSVKSVMSGQQACLATLFSLATLSHPCNYVDTLATLSYRLQRCPAGSGSVTDRWTTFARQTRTERTLQSGPRALNSPQVRAPGSPTGVEALRGRCPSRGWTPTRWE